MIESTGPLSSHLVTTYLFSLSPLELDPALDLDLERDVDLDMIRSSSSLTTSRSGSSFTFRWRVSEVGKVNERSMMGRAKGSP